MGKISMHIHRVKSVIVMDMVMAIIHLYSHLYTDIWPESTAMMLSGLHGLWSGVTMVWNDCQPATIQSLWSGLGDGKVALVVVHKINIELVVVVALVVLVE